MPIHLPREPLGPDRETNWLSLTLRIGWPEQATLDCSGFQSMAVERDEDGFSVTAVITGLVDQTVLMGMINHLNCLGLP